MLPVESPETRYCNKFDIDGAPSKPQGEIEIQAAESVSTWTLKDTGYAMLDTGYSILDAR